jgi:hypothetical protein
VAIRKRESCKSYGLPTQRLKKYGVSKVPIINPEKRAIPGRPKKKRFPTMPEKRVQKSSMSAAISEPPTLRRSRGVKKCNIVIKNIPDNNQPNVFEIGISG